MARDGRDRVTVDLRGAGPLIQQRAAAQGLTVAALVRRAVLAMAESPEAEAAGPAGVDRTEDGALVKVTVSDEWPLDHPPCVENMIAVVAVARSLGILVVGHELALDELRRLTAGKALIPALQQRRRGRWHPEDLIEPLPGQDSAWRQARWQGAQAYLTQSGIEATTEPRTPHDAGAASS